MNQDYVLGFAFNRFDQVLLIRKERPDWQRGKMNGIGGKVEKNETHLQAMRREFVEECGLDIPPYRWSRRGKCHGDSFQISVFSVKLSEAEVPLTTTDEKVQWRYIINLSDCDILPHVEAMVHCCRMTIGANDKAPFFTFHY